MKWVPDRTGKFIRRPHYDPVEIDQECERIIYDFLLKKYKKLKFPITTSDLTILVESYVEDLDMGVDLTEEDGEVEGVTEFKRGSRPTVKVSNVLVGNPMMENRLRTTLTHEFTHVTLHSFMFEIETKPRSLFEVESEMPAQLTHKCKRDNMLVTTEVDWMEWQAGYGCGAFLAPASSLYNVVKDFRQAHDIPVGILSLISDEGQQLIQTVAGEFQISRDAARVRLMQKRFLQDNSGHKVGTLFH